MHDVYDHDRLGEDDLAARGAYDPPFDLATMPAEVLAQLRDAAEDSIEARLADHAGYTTATTTRRIDAYAWLCGPNPTHGDVARVAEWRAKVNRIETDRARAARASALVESAQPTTAVA